MSGQVMTREEKVGEETWLLPCHRLFIQTIISVMMALGMSVLLTLEGMG